MLTRLTALLVVLIASAAAPGGLAHLAGAPDAQDPARVSAANTNMLTISIVMDTGLMPTGEDGFGRMTLYMPVGGDIKRQSARVTVRERGNTSRRYPKKSFRVNVVDEYGEKRNLAIADLRSDDDWIFNPMYADTSKIREALCYGLWEDMNSCSSAARSSRMTYAEVYLNGEYWGLYGVQERVDRKQVNGDKLSGVLYKITANARPTADELRAHEGADVCGGIELSFAGSRVSRPWESAAAYINVFDGGAPDAGHMPSLENAIDFGLFAMLTQAHDCHFKNQFINCVRSGGGYTLYKIPWDLNNTFGDVWKNSAGDTNYTSYHLGEPVLDDYFAILLDSGDAHVRARVKARFSELRSGVITRDALIERAHALYDPLFDAIARDAQRWPECGMGNGNARNIRDIEEYIEYIIPRMDAFINAL